MGRTAVCILLLTALATGARAEAFGLRMGDPIAKYGVKEVRSPTHALLLKVPNPHSEFEDYLVLHAPAHGICGVLGLGRDHASDASGADARASYDALKADLTAKYGAGESSERIAEGAIWAGEGEWATSLQRERTHETVWAPEAGSRLPPGLRGVELAVKATGPSTTYLQLMYQFANHADCTRVTEAQDRKGL
jgi:hypothetical protein